MGNKLEQLLNSLIEKGWKPMGKEMTDCHRERCRLNSEFGEYWVFNHIGENGQSIDRQFCLKIREIVSKNSGLWQYVCENGMLKKEGEYRAKRRHCHGWEHDEDFYHDISYVKKHDYEYRLIESALKDESELASFILNNINVDAI